MALQARLKQLPDQSGVYLFKDRAGTILYVGKARALKKRVSTYFHSGRPQADKQMRLMRDAADLEWIVTGSEAEALLVENALIISLKDDKSYPYLKITAEEAFPRLFVGRGPSEAGVRAIGPFTQAILLHQAFHAIRRVIPFRTCRTLPKRACLDYHLKLCSAPCEEKISQADYQEALAQVFRLMEGKKAEVLDELKAKMQAASKARRYEDAARFRDQTAGLIQLTVRPRRLVPSEALADLASVLRLKRLPRKIEGFDVSNIFGREAVGSMVTFVDGKPHKDGYKRFKIKAVSGIDDYAMMQEIVGRRYAPKTRYRVPKVPGTIVLPDLVVIDGGRGHLGCAVQTLKGQGLHIPVVGIAKEFEQLFLPGQREPIVLPPSSRALQLMQRIRDEAHRFAIGYHRLLRGKHTLTSALNQIPGLGPRKKQDLMVRFGSVEAMRRASPETLTQVRGISPMLAHRVHQKLRRSVRG